MVQRLVISKRAVRNHPGFAATGGFANLPPGQGGGYSIIHGDNPRRSVASKNNGRHIIGPSSRAVISQLVREAAPKVLKAALPYGVKKLRELYDSWHAPDNLDLSDPEIVWDDNQPSVLEQLAGNKFTPGLVQPTAPLVRKAKKQRINPGLPSNIGQKRKRTAFFSTPPTQKRKATPPTPKAWYNRISDSTPTQSFTQVSQAIRARTDSKFRFFRGKTRSRRNYTRAKLLFARTPLQRRALRKSAQFNSRRHRRLVRRHQRWKKKYRFR